MNLSALYELYLSHPTIFTDNRLCTPHSLFFALKGERFDGNCFAEKALENGASFAIIDNPAYKKNNRYIVVENTLETLRTLAAYHRKQLNIPIIGITGTNGKTTTKELVATILSKKYNTLCTQGNLNNHIGVPLTLLNITQEHQIAIIEMGANHVGEINNSTEIVRPNFGLITNIGKAHIGEFGSFENIIKTKGELYQFLEQTNGTIFINSDNLLLASISNNLSRHTYATFDTSAEIVGHVVKHDPLVSVEWWRNGDRHYSVETNLIGGYNLENILAAICVGNFFGVESEAINQALREYIPKNNRSQLHKTERNHLVIDAYNANPTSMEATLINYAKAEGLQHKVVLLGDMLELGECSQKEHEHIIDIITELGFEQVFLIGQEFAKIAHKYPTFTDVDAFIKWEKLNPLHHCTILIKGSHGLHLEKVIQHL